MAVLRTAEAAEAIGAGPGVLADPQKVFPYTVPGVNLTDELVLKMARWPAQTSTTKTSSALSFQT